jgi:diaminohydroxyphosphoribosylaminopyrimidine deaminase/5-amino-6-(5-phosphoribosylamino)uracil reductase
MHQDISDRRFMAEAIRLAERGLYTTSPNPRVGCVIVRGERVIARGFHRRAGCAHAEVEALNAAVEALAGATAYVTLEPCSHHGRTPPCADALVASGVGRVVVAGRDPNPMVAGEGIRRLREAGVAVSEGLLETEARELNPGFFKRMMCGLPWVRLKLATSLDGRTAMASGESKWITSTAARRDVQRLRARSCAVLTGVETILHDDPRLDVRAEDIGLEGPVRQPLRVVVDSRLRVPPAARIFGEPGEVILASAVRESRAEAALQSVGANLLCLPDARGRVDLRALLQHLAEAQCNEVLIEAGAKLAGSALAAGLVDELVAYVAPVLMGSAARPLVELPFVRMEERMPLVVTDIVAVGSDWRITAKPAAGRAIASGENV